MSRLNPLQPGTCRRTVSLETVQRHHDIEEQKLRGKREIYRKRNEMYVKSMYGNPSEKEEVKQDSRTALLQQMKEKDLADKTATTEKTKESDFAINYDRICLQQDRQDRINKEKYLQQFRNENKRLIELRAEQQKNNRESRHLEERNLLQQSPINWSHTLHRLNMTCKHNKSCMRHLHFIVNKNSCMLAFICGVLLHKLAAGQVKHCQVYSINFNEGKLQLIFIMNVFK